MTYDGYRQTEGVFGLTFDFWLWLSKSEKANQSDRSKKQFFFIKADFRKTESITGLVFNDFFMEL
jgi:hypothetical protein